MARSVCVIDECLSYVSARGWCSKHYTRWKRHGVPTARIPGEVVDGKRICSGCSEDLPLSAYTSGGTGPCKECRAEHKRSRYIPVPTVDLPAIHCIQCGKKFGPRSVRVLACSVACSESRKRAMDTYYVNRDGRVKANEANRRWASRNVEKAADGSRRYRAKKLGATVEKFTRQEVFARDGWVCGICEEPIPKDAHYPSPWSATLDHIIPLAKGGEHSKANAQAAHLRCNLSKGDRIAA